MFAPQLAALSDACQIVVIHQPGVGATTVDCELSLDGIARMQHEVLGLLGLPGPFHVGGASVGAIFAQSFALRYSGDTASLSLLGGSYKFANRKGQIDKLDQVIAEDFAQIRAGTPDAPALRNEAETTARLLRCESMEPRTGLRYLDLFAREPALAPRLSEIQVPTLIVQGRHDSVVGIKTGHFLHGAIPNSTYVELPDSGHFVCWTDGERVNRELRAFLTGLDALCP
jgi:pimeloyl-ACP methyl ester carboxylesterase